MSLPVDPIRRAFRTRIVRRAKVDRLDGARDMGEDRDPDRDPPEAPAPEHLSDGSPEFSAQLIGQDGIKRGLKGGLPILDAARTAYQATEWSGTADRRTATGRIKRTKI